MLSASRTSGVAAPSRRPPQEEDQPEDEYIAKFVLMRDPNKPSMFLYNVAPDTFERDDEIEVVGGAAEEDGWGPAPAVASASAASASAAAAPAVDAHAQAQAADDEEAAAIAASAPAAKSR
jgi:hypothetical protein